MYIVDGNWSEWNDWATCSVTCGGGVQNRSRTCTNPPPAFGGEPCQGESDETRTCNEDPCPGKVNNFRQICFVVSRHLNITLQVLLSYCHTLLLAEMGRISQSIYGIHVE